MITYLKIPIFLVLSTKLELTVKFVPNYIEWHDDT